MISIEFKNLLTFICFLFCSFETENSKMMIKMTDVFVNKSNIYKSNVSANIRTVDKKNLLTVNFTAPEDLIENIMFTGSLHRFANNKYIPLIKNLTANMCSVFRKPSFPPMLMPIYKEYLLHTDMPPRCPILKNTYTT